MRRLSLLAVLVLSGCPSPSAPNGFGVNLTVNADGLGAARAAVSSVRLSVTGDNPNPFEVDLPIATQLQQSEARFRYLPVVQSGALTFTVTCFDGAKTLIASGRAGTTVRSDGASEATIVLHGGGVGDDDMAVPADMAVPSDMTELPDLLPPADLKLISCVALIDCQNKCTSQACVSMCQASATATAKMLFNNAVICINDTCSGTVDGGVVDSGVTTDAGAPRCANPNSPDCQNCIVNVQSVSPTSLDMAGSQVCNPPADPACGKCVQQLNACKADQ